MFPFGGKDRGIWGWVRAGADCKGISNEEGQNRGGRIRNIGGIGWL